MNRILKPATFALFGILLAACSPDTNSKIEDLQTQELSANMSSLEVKIRAIVQSPLANASEHCKVVVFGKNSCGEAAHYLLYSNQNTDEAALLTLLSQYNAMSLASQSTLQPSGYCPIAPKPEIVLRKGLCLPIETKEM